MKWSWQAKVAVLGWVLFVLGIIALVILEWLSPVVHIRATLNDVVISRDGTQVVFVIDSDTRTNYRGRSDLYVGDADGRNLRRLATVIGHATPLRDPMWSDDGQYIRYMQDFGSHTKHFSIGAEGTNRQELTETAFQELDVASIQFWSEEQTVTSENSPFAYKRHCLDDGRNDECPALPWYQCVDEELHIIDKSSGDMIGKIDPQKLIGPGRTIEILEFTGSTVASAAIVLGPLMPFVWLYNRRHWLAVTVMALNVTGYVLVSIIIFVDPPFSCNETILVSSTIISALNV